MTKTTAKLIVTLGPSTRTEADLRRLKDKGVDFVRINMSHSSLDDLSYFISLAQKVGLPFIIDTEGSQIRTHGLEADFVSLEESQAIQIHKELAVGNAQQIALQPAHIIDQLEPGDLLFVDFNHLTLRISDTSTLTQGYITATAVTSGRLGSNKAVVVESALGRTFDLPPLSDKDYKSIEFGLKQGIEHIAASFMRSGNYVEAVRQATQGKMQIISKIECLDALHNLDEIIKSSDSLLIDRGDLSKEVALEKIPLAQKIIIDKAKRTKKEVFMATNLLESMIENKRPTRAEVHDVEASLLAGATGLALSAETAIGRYPMQCVNVASKLIKQAEFIAKQTNQASLPEFQDEPAIVDYLADSDESSALLSPHGSKLVNRALMEQPDSEYLASLPQLKLNESQQMDVEQIAIGTFSPLEGFMNEADFNSVLDKMQLSSGEVWTIPIMLDVNDAQAAEFKVGNDVALHDAQGPMAILHLEEIFSFNPKQVAKQLYGTTEQKHPGVTWLHSLKPKLLGGKIDLLRRRVSEYKEYELTPRQVRRVFEERDWIKVAGFHTRNVIHRSHEFIQLRALEQENCDGLFVHPVTGKKKPGDYQTKYIIESYETMMKNHYPKDKVVFATFSTFSRYAGPREAVFTALCRKNFGCSHFVVGRDHTGVADFYEPEASHKIFEDLPSIGIKPLKFDEVFYSEKNDKHFHHLEVPNHPESDKQRISGTQARQMLERQEAPPDWYMRPELSDKLLAAIKAGEEVFVPAHKSKDGAVLWLTGLSGSGKSTLAEALQKHLASNSLRAEIIDGDAVRAKQHKHLSFSREDIRENNRLIAELASKRASSTDFILVPVISPYLEDRARNRELIGDNYHEVHVDCSLDECIQRDPKGIYRKAQKGEIDNMIGLDPDTPYEPPVSPELQVATHELSPKQSLELIIKYLKDNNLIE